MHVNVTLTCYLLYNCCLKLRQLRAYFLIMQLKISMPNGSISRTLLNKSAGSVAGLLSTKYGLKRLKAVIFYLGH